MEKEEYAIAYNILVSPKSSKNYHFFYDLLPNMEDAYYNEDEDDYLNKEESWAMSKLERAKRQYDMATLILSLADSEETMMKNKNLKLFVWENVLQDWTNGVMFALAENVTQARFLVNKKWHDGCHQECDENTEFFNDDLLREPKVYDDLCGFFVYGGG